MFLPFTLADGHRDQRKGSEDPLGIQCLLPYPSHPLAVSISQVHFGMISCHSCDRDDSSDKDGHAPVPLSFLSVP